MNRCPNCAAQNRDGAKFCTSCGFRLPADSAPVVTSDRSPFATTSSVPPQGEATTQPVANGNSSSEGEHATWTTEPTAQPTHGRSWDAAPPQNTGVPVSDEMIASLVDDTDTSSSSGETAVSDSVEPTVEPFSYLPSWENAIRPESSNPGAPASIDRLLTLTRELEHGLVELSELPGASRDLASSDRRLLSNVLADLQDDDALATLRTAVATAQERPRDVDVMLDLVLRADAIAALLTERDQLKGAISIVLNGAPDVDVADAESDVVESDVVESDAESVEVEIDQKDATSELNESELEDDEQSG